MTSKRVIVAMSGGVDSTIAAIILKEEGWEVIGVNLNFFGSPGAGERRNDIGSDGGEDARQVAQELRIPFYVFNVEKEFQKEVIDYFCGEYCRGRTPNPCIICNQKLKFGILRKKAKFLNADYIATGHYARVEYDNVSKRYLLKKGLDTKKDQSYFLSFLRQDQLGSALFPLGSYLKNKTRKMAQKLGLKIYDKPESQEICFIPDNNYRMFLKERCSGEIMPGPIVDIRGEVLGEHRGIPFYTIGQRRGLGIARGFPLYVIAIDRGKNKIIVGEKKDTYRVEFIASEVNWIGRDKIDPSLKIKAKIRYNHHEGEVMVTPLPHGRTKVIFEKPQLAITPGQAAVFYQGDEVVGGGWIEEVRN